MVNLPFSETDDVRTFSKDLTERQLKWHWDEEDRLVYPLHVTDWKLQLDNEIPKLLSPIEEPVFIAAGTWHRLIVGSQDLHLKVIKIRHVTRPAFAS